MKFYSIVIPVFNRPVEVDELLHSLTKQTFTNFEVVIVEDGSTEKCDTIIDKYRDKLDIQYFFKPNSGQGFSRNYGFERAKGDYFVVFDSDCLIPSHYLETVDKELTKRKFDAYGGPDKSHDSFSTIQKAISYSMTSPFTTGGIRGSKKHVGTFHPRSFNMGISKAVFEKTKGYIIPFKGEDIEFSIRIIENGFKTGLIENAYVYHKRRTSLTQFYKQLHFFGTARVNISRFFPKELKLIHALPAFFVIGLIVYLLLPIYNFTLFKLATFILVIYYSAIFIDATTKNKSIKVGLWSIATSFVQLTGYGIGFLRELWVKLFKE